MAQRIADRRDIDFVLYEQLQIEGLFEIGRFRDLNRKSADMVITEARRLGLKEILPTYAEGDRTASEALAPGFWRVTTRCGFMERPDAVRAIEDWAERPEHADPMQVTYFLSRETVVPGRGGRGFAARWRDRVFVAMSRNAASVTDYFHIPDNRVVELGTRVQM